MRAALFRLNTTEYFVFDFRKSAAVLLFKGGALSSIYGLDDSILHLRALLYMWSIITFVAAGVQQNHSPLGANSFF